MTVITPEDPPTLHEQLIIKLRIALPLIQRSMVLARQSHQDLKTALDALDRMHTLLAVEARMECDHAEQGKRWQS